MHTCNPNSSTPRIGLTAREQPRALGPEPRQWRLGRHTLPGRLVLARKCDDREQADEHRTRGVRRRAV